MRTRSLSHARTVLEHDTDDARAPAFAAFPVALLERDYGVALDAVNRALAFTPNSPIVLSLSARGPGNGFRCSR